MNFIDLLGQQPKSRLMWQGIACLILVAVIDLVTSWKFSMFIFYCAPVYVISLHFPKRTAITFTLATVVVATAANYDTIEFRGLAGFAWMAVNRLGGLLFVTGCGISFRSYRDEMLGRIEAMRRTQQLEREIVNAGERERERIGQDLHDGVCQTLAAIDCAIQCLKVDLESDQSPRIGLTAEIQKQLSLATQEARNMARSIYPVSISDDNLPDAIQDLATTMNSLFRGSIRVRSDEEVIVKDRDTATHLYRIAQEALSNAVRHANATRIDVDISQDDQGVTMSISDDGCGSSIQKRPDGMGQHTMRYRANLIGARITMKTAPSRGTSVTCTVPAARSQSEPVAAAAV